LLEALDVGGAWVERHRAPLEGALDTIRGHLAWLEIRGTPEGATVRVDGRDVGTLPLDGPIRVVAGDVVLRVSAEGYAPKSRPLRLDPGDRAREMVRLVTEASGEAPAAGEFIRRGSPTFGSPRATTMLTELGYSAIPRATIFFPLASWFSWGARAGIDAALFHSVGEHAPGTLTAYAALPLRFGLVDSSKIGVGLELAPGIGLTMIDYTDRLGLSDVDTEDVDLTGEYAAVLLHASLDVGYRLSRVVTIGGGLDVPTTLFFGSGGEVEELLERAAVLVGPVADVDPLSEFRVVPILLGPSLELRVSEGVTLGATIRLGPHILSGDIARDLLTELRPEGDRIELGLRASLGLAIAL